MSNKNAYRPPGGHSTRRAAWLWFQKQKAQRITIKKTTIEKVIPNDGK